MPIYNYTCQDCGYKQEVITYKIEDKKYNCKKCGSVMKKDIAIPAISRLGNSLYDNSRDIQRGLEGKPYKGRYFDEDNTSNMG